MSVTPPASAQASFSITVGTPPPPLRYEAVPAPRVGYVWAPGYWNWNGYRYVWVGGTWHHSRPGYVYYGPRWVHSGGRWVYHDRYWGHDPHWRGRHDNGRHRGWDHDRGHDRRHGYDRDHDHDHDRDHGRGH
ncbi:MAG: hypothetical protein ACTHJG_05735 [Rhodanobacteraceae bacterium]